MSTIKSTRRFAREDVADAIIFATITAILLSGLEFFFTAMSLHYVTIPILAAEAAAAVIAGALISLVAIKATDDED